MIDQADKKRWFGQLVQENMDAMYGVALRLTGNGTSAEDLVADTVIKAWSNIEKLKDRDRVRPWIFRILRNEFISAYRKSSIRPKETAYEENGTDEDHCITSFMTEQPDGFMNWWANPEKEYINGLLGEQIRSAINRLPDVFRITILLINVEGLSYDEAAVILGVPCGTVRSRMKRGRTLLQKTLWTQAQEAGLTPERNKLTHQTGV